VPIIIDGGIRESGDIVKALVAGISGTKNTIMVMAGSIFAACLDSPGELISIAGINMKRYWGSASVRQKGSVQHIEGFEIELPCNGLTIEQKYSQLKDSISSAISYAGGTDLSSFRKTKWIPTK
jgi:GMP reductase